MGPGLGGLVAGFVVLAALRSPLERWRPALPAQPLRRDGLWTDVAYWFFTPLVTRSIARIAVLAAVLLLALGAGVPLQREAIQTFVAGSGRAVQQQPLGLQVVEVLLLGDLIGYWMHRLFHGRRLWPFHAVHHSSRQLDWLSSVRLHPVNDALARIAQAIPILLIGFPPGLVAAYVPFLGFYALFIHANVPWSFGPLRYAIASPCFHRWHHTSQAEGRDRNFAGLLPLWDLMFGTFYMPPGRQPERFGVEGESVPDGLLGQLAHPFRSRRARVGAA